MVLDLIRCKLLLLGKSFYLNDKTFLDQDKIFYIGAAKNTFT